MAIILRADVACGKFTILFFARQTNLLVHSKYVATTFYILYFERAVFIISIGMFCLWKKKAMKNHYNAFDGTCKNNCRIHYEEYLPILQKQRFKLGQSFITFVDDISIVCLNI